MRRPQVTIATLIIIVLIAAVGFAALRGGERWSGVMTSIWLFALVCAPLGIALGRDARRVYWLGFTVLGWTYLIIALVPVLFQHIGQYTFAPPLFAWLEEVMASDAQVQASVSLGRNPVMGFRSITVAAGFSGGFTDMSLYQRVGVAMEGLIWAFLGGWVARYFASGRAASIPATSNAAPQS